MPAAAAASRPKNELSFSRSLFFNEFGIERLDLYIS
jgi:hypothetical protein